MFPTAVAVTPHHPLLHFSFPSKHRPRHTKAFSSLSPISSNTSLSSSESTTNHHIQSLCSQGHLSRAMSLLPRLPSPSHLTLSSLLSAAASASSLAAAAAIHRRIASDPHLSGHPFLSTRLIDAYSSLGSLAAARQVFDETSNKTIYVWNALLKALALADEAEEALARLRDMAQHAVAADSFTYSHALKACIVSSSCASLGLRRVRQLHAHALRRGHDCSVHVGTTLVDCYGKLGSVAYAERVFGAMLERNVVSWSAMIACYAKNERPYDALQLFREMMAADRDVVPNSVTVVSVLQACASVAALGQGKILHGYVLRKGLDSVVPVLNTLVAMYVKCGCLDTGRHMFDWMAGQRDVISWNSLISGYGMYGFGHEAIRVFEEMIESGVSPSSISFVSVLGACSHAGLVEEGKKLFESMVRVHGVAPRAEHYACMVDLLGRAGQLDEAVELIQDMGIEPSPTVWGSLLGASRIHGNVEYAEMACSHLFDLEPMNAGNYVLLADIYARAQLFEQVSVVKELLEEHALEKVPGCSWIEVNKKTYSFVSVDETNPHVEQLQALLVQFVDEMKKHGYVPDTKVVLYNVDQQEKERILLSHSEKLAVAFGLINSGKGEVIRITKNLRLCEDCHSVTKFISKFAKREILVRDVNRFHHFKDGVCSCADYW